MRLKHLTHRILPGLIAAAFCLAVWAVPAGPAFAEPVGEGEPPAVAERTVMLYLCGSDLESGSLMATHNLKQILKAIINYCAKEYPAKKYDLILWDHGEGPLGGYGLDKLDEEERPNEKTEVLYICSSDHRRISDPAGGIRIDLSTGGV